MLNTNKFFEIGKDIFLFKSFLNIEEANMLFNIAKNLDDSKWNNQSNLHFTSGAVHEIQFAIERMKEFVSGDIVLDDSCYFQKYLNGQGMGIHQDNNKVLKDIEKSKDYKEGTPYKIVRQPMYGVVLYLNSIEGGEIFYPEQNITYSPMPGDLVIHSAEFHCRHGVNPNKSDLRICIPTYIYKEIKVPI